MSSIRPTAEVIAIFTKANQQRSVSLAFGSKPKATAFRHRLYRMRKWLEIHQDSRYIIARDLIIRAPEPVGDEWILRIEYEGDSITQVLHGAGITDEDIAAAAALDKPNRPTEEGKSTEDVVKDLYKPQE